MLRIIAAGLIAALVSLPAAAQSVCGKRGEFLEQLSHNYAEAPVALGLVSNGAVLEVLVSNKGSWTIIVTRTDGTSCVVASGDEWQELPTLIVGEAA